MMNDLRSNNLYAQASESAREIAEIRAAILKLYDEFMASHQAKLGIEKARQRFIELWNNDLFGRDIKERWNDFNKKNNRKRDSDLSKDKLRNWEISFKESGLSGLLEHFNNGGVRTDPKVIEIITKLIFENHLVRYKDIYEALQIICKDAPAPGTVRNIAKKIKEDNWAALVLKHEGQRGLRDRNLTVAIGKADGDLSEPNARIELDTTLADIMVKGENSAGKRLKLVGVIDVYSRNARFFLVHIESSRAIGDIIKKCILLWGCPKEIVIDNGSAYRNKRVIRFLKRIGVKLRICTPGEPVEKPFIERIFRTVTDQVFRRLPGYTGNSLKTRPREIKVALTKDELQIILDDWCENIYAERPHSTTKQRPRERMAKQGYIPYTFKEEDLDILIMSEVERTVNRGCVRYQGGRYFHEKLPEGCRVEIRINDMDASKVLVYFKGKFICEARDLIREGTTPKEIKEAKRARNNELRVKIKAQEQLLKKYDLSKTGIITSIEAAKKRRPIEIPRKARLVEFPNLLGPSASQEPDDQKEFFFKDATEKYVFLKRKKLHNEVLTKDERKFIEDFLEDEHYQLLLEDLDNQARREAI